MSNQQVLMYPDPLLKTVSTPFTEEEFKDGLPAAIEEELRSSIRCFADRASGLAAPQIGICRRIFILKSGTEITVMVNPEIIKQTKPTIHRGEGCLSLPQTNLYDVPRYKRIVVRFQGSSGTPYKIQYRGGIQTYTIQHELDHLDGLMINDNRT